MAKNIAKEAANGSDHATKTHNVKARSDAFRDSISETYKLDCEIESAIEKYVKPLRDAKRDIKAKLRDDYNVTAKAFNARYGAYKFERRAREAGDDASLDTLRELYEASPVGGQLDFVDAMQKADAAASAATH